MHVVAPSPHAALGADARSSTAAAVGGGGTAHRAHDVDVVIADVEAAGFRAHRIEAAGNVALRVAAHGAAVGNGETGGVELRGVGGQDGGREEDEATRMSRVRTICTNLEFCADEDAYLGLHNQKLRDAVLGALDDADDVLAASVEGQVISGPSAVPGRGAPSHRPR